MMKTKKDPKAPLLKASELAPKDQVTPATLLKWQRDGKIPAAIAIGKVVRFDADEVDAALSELADRERASAAGVLVRVV